MAVLTPTSPILGTHDYKASFKAWARPAHQMECRDSGKICVAHGCVLFEVRGSILPCLHGPLKSFFIIVHMWVTSKFEMFPSSVKLRILDSARV